MLSSFRLFFLVYVFAALASGGTRAHAESWWSRIFDVKPAGSQSAQDLEKATTLAVGEFTGATGTTAAKAIGEQLATSDEVQLGASRAGWRIAKAR
jgi:hypothetical protein